MNRALLHSIVGWATVLLVGCAASVASPVEPPKLESPQIEGVDSAQSSLHTLFGVWNIDFDLSAGTVEIFQDRSALKHFKITDALKPPACDDCVAVKIVKIDYTLHQLVFDVTFKNPFPKISGYNVRGIIMSDDPNHKITNADGYTKYWDPQEPARINPYLGFPQATDVEPYPVFPGGESRTRQFQMTFGDPPGFAKIHYEVDACYPGKPDEPALISDISVDGSLYPSGGDCIVSLKAYDAQNNISSVAIDLTPLMGGSVELDKQADGVTWTTWLSNTMTAPIGGYRSLITAKSLNSGDIALYNYVALEVGAEPPPPPIAFFQITSPEPYMAGDAITFDASGSAGEITEYDWDWGGTPETVTDPVVQHTFDTEGTYEVSLIVKGPNGSSDPYGMQVDVLKSGGVHFTDVTPPDLNFNPSAMVVQGNYAYVATTYTGLVIFDITDPSNPVMVKRVPINKELQSIEVVNGYAYMVTRWWDNKDVYDIEIVDVDPIDSAHVVNEWKPGDYDASGIHVDGNYAYVRDFSSQLDDYKFEIYDISDPAAPVYVGGLNPEYGSPTAIDVAGGIAYCADGLVLDIIDVGNPQEPTILNSVIVDYQAYFRTLKYLDGYVFLTSSIMGKGLYVVDVDPIADASEVYKSSSLVSEEGRSTIIGNYLYLANYDGVHVLDISNPASPSEVGLMEQDQDPTFICIDGGNMYTLCYNYFKTFQFTAPSTAVPLRKLMSPGAQGHGVVADGDVLYYAGVGVDGLKVLDISNPESAHITKNFGLDFTGDVWIKQGNYAYVGGYPHVFRVLDVSVPGEPSQVASVTVPYYIHFMILHDGYAYATMDTSGMVVIDITTPESPQVVKTITGLGATTTLAAYENYVYLCNQTQNAGVQIVDVSVPGSAHVVGAFGTDLKYAMGIQVVDHYLYVGDSNVGMDIYDLTDPLNPSKIGTIPDISNVWNTCMGGGYMFASGYYGTKVIDMSQPESPTVVGSFPVGRNLRGVEAGPDGYYYALDYNVGLRIIKGT